VTPVSPVAYLIVAKVAFDLGRLLSSRHLTENLLDHAARSLRGARAALANPATLPLTYRN
jgi:hypothetical protein